MKILLINEVHFPRGGADVVYLNTGEMLTQQGHEVLYFSFHNSKNIPCSQESFFVKMPSKIQSILNFFYNKQCEKQLEKLIKVKTPDIAHAHLFWSNLSPAVCCILHKYDIPLVQTIHDFNLLCPISLFKRYDNTICEECKGKYFYKCIEYRCFKKNLLKSSIMAAGLYYRNKFYNPIKNIDGFIFVSQFSHIKHKQYIPTIEGINSMVLYNCSQVSPQFYNKYNRGYFIFFGRLSNEKGLYTLIKALAYLKDVKLKIVGTGPEETNLKKVIIDANIKNIDFLGYKSGDELKTLICNASFTIIPSTCLENNPMTIVESYSAGVPVIGSNIGGIPEIIIENKTGYVFESGDAESLIKVIKKAHILTIVEYKVLSDNAYQFATENFNKTNYLKKLLDFYRLIYNK